ncbi:MAG: Ig-like domain-containing protein [candidate division KSB1 bacterium]|nr:Ig-like domain-containing protein [candidate division KSB1 bacterium]
MNRVCYIIFSVIIIIFIFTCAKQMPPPGGPVDTITPKVTNITPAPGAINVATRTKIEIVFSEGMNHKSVENAIFLAP